MKLKRILTIFFILICIFCFIGAIYAEDTSDLDLNTIELNENDNNEIAYEMELSYENANGINDNQGSENEDEVLADDDCCGDDSNNDNSPEGTIWYVQPDSDNPNQVQKPTIQPVIDQANPGDTIVLNGSFVHCHFTINKTLNFVATPGTSLGICPHHQLPMGSGNYGIIYITEDGSGSTFEGIGFTNDFYHIGNGQYNPFAFLIDGASNVTLKNLTFNWTGKVVEGYDKDPQDYIFNPIILRNANNVTLENLFINNTLNAIDVENSSIIRIINTTIVNTKESQIILGENVNGIVFENNHFESVDENTIDNSTDSNDTNYTVKLLSTKVSASNLSLKVGDNGIFSVILKDADGNALKNQEIKLIVNGKTYKGTTDSSGKAKITLKYSSSGTYYGTIVFSGDDSYKSSLTTAKITVSKKISTLTAAKKTFKVKSTKRISFTLKSNGKALKSKKITLKVNGKTFSAKTNSRGVAKITIKLSKKGSFKYSVKFAGDKTYKAVSKTNKIIIK